MKHWQSKNFLAYALWPISLFYRIAANLHRNIYRLGLKKTNRFNVPVIVVGNITVGGTGKTPLVIYLAKLLRKQGYHPGVVSHGYKAKAKCFPQIVTCESDASAVGDEAVVLAQQLTCPVIVSPKRSIGVQALIEQHQCDVVLTDDGLQHHALVRTIEIAVIDGERRYGNGFYLPAGPLRESIARLQSVDFIVANGVAAANEFAMHLVAGEIYNLTNPQQKLALTDINQPIHAVAGIGYPERFFNLLNNLGLKIIPHAFPDHYAFKEKDLVFTDTDIVIMTEKDAVKCRNFAKHNYWCLPITAELDGKFSSCFLQTLTQHVFL